MLVVISSPAKWATKRETAVTGEVFTVYCTSRGLNHQVLVWRNTISWHFAKIWAGFLKGRPMRKIRDKWNSLSRFMIQQTAWPGHDLAREPAYQSNTPPVWRSAPLPLAGAQSLPSARSGPGYSATGVYVRCVCQGRTSWTFLDIGSSANKLNQHQVSQHQKQSGETQIQTNDYTQVTLVTATRSCCQGRSSNSDEWLHPSHSSYSHTILLSREKLQAWTKTSHTVRGRLSAHTVCSQPASRLSVGRWRARASIL